MGRMKEQFKIAFSMILYSGYAPMICDSKNIISKNSIVIQWLFVDGMAGMVSLKIIKIGRV